MQPNLVKGVFFVFLASASYALMGVLVKLGGTQLNDAQLVFMRNFTCLVLLLPFLFFPQRKPLATSVWPTHLLRATAGILNMYCFFYSIRFILLSDAMVLNNTMPLFVPLVLWVWKKRKIFLGLIPGLIIGFLGVLLILQPTKGIFQPASFLALASGSNYE